MAAAISQFLLRQPHRNPEVDEIFDKLKPRGHHSDNFVSHTIEQNLFSDYSAIAGEMTLPEFMADHCNTVRAWCVFLGEEGSPQLRVDPEYRKEIGGHAISYYPFRPPIAGQIEFAPVQCRHSLKTLILRPPIVEVRRRRLVSRETR